MLKRASRSRSREVEVSSNVKSNPIVPADTSISHDVSSTRINTKKRKISKPVRSNNSSKSIMSYPKVESILLELPFRGLFEFEDANTYETLPDLKFRQLFDKFITETTPKKTINTDTSISKNKLKSIHFNDFEIDTWYRSPYPLKYNSNTIMHICPHCLAYYASSFTLNRHLLKCSYKNQPDGREIYRDEAEKVSIIEVDGRKNVIFCQNLCLLAKLFLNSKTLYYDVEPFMFYVLYDYSVGSFNFIGYFSKEKLNSTGYNLSCIMTLPIYQRRGFGSFLIDFSYLLSKREFKTGSPEKPLSHLGLLSYRSYWKMAVMRAVYSLMFENHKISFQVSSELTIKDHQLKDFKVSIDDISNLTGMCHDDVIVGLEQLNSFLVYNDGSRNEYALIFNISLVKQLYQTWQKKHTVKVNNDYLFWKPVILGPSGGINTNSTMVITDESTDDTLMKNVSVIYNFLQDDLDDDRDIEDQTMEKIQLQQKDEVSNFRLLESSICYPGMKLTKNVAGKNVGVGKTNGNQNSIKESIKRDKEITTTLVDEDAMNEIFKNEGEESIDNSSEDEYYNDPDANLVDSADEESDEDEIEDGASLTDVEI